jgi:hypothetical protein
VLLCEGRFAAKPACPAAAAAKPPAAVGTTGSTSAGAGGWRLRLLDAHSSLHRVVGQDRRKTSAHLTEQRLQHRGLRLAAAAAAGAATECRVDCRVRGFAATCAGPAAALAFAAAPASAVLVLA